MSALDRLAARRGILARWRGTDGVERETGPETKLALLRAMGLGIAGEKDAAAALAEEGEREAVEVVEAGRPAPLPAPEGGWLLGLEDGGAQTGRSGEALPPLPAGVHRLAWEGGGATVIAAPRLSPQPPVAWGVTGALYGLVSDRSIGRGDYEDLARAAEALGGLGAGFLGINPVHDPGAGAGLSPYSPSSRTAFDPRHIAVEQAPGFAGSPRARALFEGSAEARAAAMAAPLGDAELRARLGPAILRACFEDGGGEAPGFSAWISGRGEEGARHALFSALAAAHGGDWREWPEALRSPGSTAAAAFAASHPRERRFHGWLQWVAEGQIAKAQERARAAGMALGLYLDIAVGVLPGGAETWALRDAFARGVSLGSPPDAFNASGQEWGLAPFEPRGLAQSGWAPFRAMLREAMSRAGMVRIDHVLGFERAFWVPQDGAPGGYVRQDAEALLALTRIEAARAGCVVVGEDLGAVPPGFRDRLEAAGLLGCAVLQFEGGAKGFATPRRWRRRSVAAFGTHDTPTLAGWWTGADIDQRQALGHLGAAAAKAEHANRAGARAALLRALDEEGLAHDRVSADDPGAADFPALRDAVHALLARSGSALVAVQLDDALGEAQQRNVPGTVDEAPNWRLRHRVPPEALGEAPEMAALARLMHAEGR